MSQSLKVHVFRKENQLGVYSVNDVLTLLRKRVLQPSDLYWYKGMGKPEPIFGQKINVKYATLSHHRDYISNQTEMTELAGLNFGLPSCILGAPWVGRQIRNSHLGPDNFHNVDFFNEPIQVALIQHHAELIGGLEILGDALEETNQSSVLPISNYLVSWLKEAAKLGDRLAQYELFHCYKNGLGVAKNDAEADHWMRQYVLHVLNFTDRKRVLTNIADIYEAGRLVQQDLTLAYLLYTLDEALYPRDHEDYDHNDLFDIIYDLERKLSIEEVFAAHTVKEEMMQRSRHSSFHGHNLEEPPHDGWCPYGAGEINEVNETKDRVSYLMRPKGHVKSMLIKAKSHMETAASLEGSERTRELLDAFFESKVASILGRRRFLEQKASMSFPGKNGGPDELLDANVNISTLDRDLYMHPSRSELCRLAEKEATDIITGYNPQNLSRSFLESGKFRVYPWGNGT